MGPASAPPLLPLHAGADAASTGLPGSAWAVFWGLLVLLAVASVAAWAYVRRRFADDPAIRQ
jgi:hypothetical protein